MCYPRYQRSSTHTALLKLLLAHSACTRCNRNTNDRCRYSLFLSPATAQRRPRFSPPKIPHHHATRSMTLAGHATWLMPYYAASQAMRCPTPPQATLPKLFAAHAIAAGMQQPGAHTTPRKLHMFLTAHTKQLDCRPSHTSFRQHSLPTQTMRLAIDAARWQRLIVAHAARCLRLLMLLAADARCDARCPRNSLATPHTTDASDTC